MDRKWMSANRLTKEYWDGMKEFVRFAVDHADNPNKIICPCLKCCYGKLISATELEEHLVCNGIDQSYTRWTKHGETNDECNDLGYSGSCGTNDFNTSTFKADRLKELANVIEEELQNYPEMFERLKSNAEMVSPHEHDEEIEPRVQKELEKHRRGLTVLKHVKRAKDTGQRIHVEWNKKGQPIKKGGNNLISYIGVAVKQHVSISHRDWRKVPDELKDDVFRDILEGFNINLSRKEYVIGKAGLALKNFRYLLTKRFMKDQEGNIRKHPPKIFEVYIKQHDWDAFIDIRRDESFQALSQQNSERAKNPQYPYRAGRSGYSSLEDKLLMQQGSQGSLIPRHVLWIEARKNKEGIIDNENVRKICEEIDVLSQSMPKVSQEGSGLDILGKALGVPEYPGRVRGIGFGVTKKAYFGTQRRSSLESTKVARLEAIVQQQHETQCQMERRLAELTELVLKMQSAQGTQQEA